MDLYKYETHLHTSEASACATYSGAEQVRSYKEAGYEGIFVTDHFFNGNTAIPRNLSWEERINRFCKGYENAKQEGDRIGLSVFLGWEVNYQCTEFLIYGLDKDWLLHHPDILSWSLKEHYDKVKAAGGFVVHAHPFREREYIKEIRLFPELTDAVEVFNVGNQNEEFDRRALAYANKHKLPMTAGTDAHGKTKLHSGMSFRTKLIDDKDFISKVQNGEYELLPPS